MLKKSLAAGAVAAASAGILFSATPAYAAYGDVLSAGNGGIVAGNQAAVDADTAVNGCGNAVAVVGNAGGACYNSGIMINTQ
ncbi:chaplin family protein [Streptomonospora litoralis]|uniref:Chaplin domain-containing protein n=1 Tax=Streptomonospora litoralis TaxID=2498135 RepID=A0A4P6Q5V6_9ACTN|nr:chaplin family protein [Streptomonospora litoralis]QBI56075.1 hypothetical protein EKD16_21600 [Streptomonospora litoralis]